MSTTVDALDPVDRLRPGFDHIGLLYGDEQAYLTTVTRFARDAVRASAPLLIAVPSEKLAALRRALGADPAVDTAEVDFVDMTVVGRNPGRIIPKVLLAFAQRYPDRQVWIVDEPVWSGRHPDEHPACTEHEILVNVVFAGRPAVLLCPYDARSLPAEVVADAQRTHPIVTDGAGRRPSARYLPPASALHRVRRPLPAPPGRAATIGFADTPALAGVRRFVTGQARAAGLDRDRVDDLALAVNELATNTVRHTAASGRVWLWVTSKAVVCQVEDTGHLADPLAGRIPRPPDQPGGRGLLLVHDLCDLVRVYTRPGQTTVRVYVDRPPAR